MPAPLAAANSVCRGFLFYWGCLVLLCMVCIPHANAQTGPSVAASLGPFVWVTNTGGYHTFTVTGGVGELTYSFSPALPSGLAVSHGTPSSFVQTGAATVTALSTYSMTITDANGDSDTSSVEMQVLAGVPTFSLAEYNYTFTQGTAETITLPQAASGDLASNLIIYQFGVSSKNSQAYYTVRGYTISAFNNAQYPITITREADAVVHSDTTDSIAFYAYVANPVTLSSVGTTTIKLVVITPAPYFATPQPDLTYSARQANAFTLAEATADASGGTITYSLTRQTGTFPTALTFDEATRELSTADTVDATAAGDYILSAGNDNGSGDSTFTLTAHDPPEFAAANLGTFVFVSGGLGEHSFNVTGGSSGDVTLTVAPPLPNGLETNYSTSSQTVFQSGTATVTPLTEYTITATDANGNFDTAQMWIQVTANPPAFAQSGYNFTFVQGASRTITLPKSTGDAPDELVRHSIYPPGTLSESDALSGFDTNGFDVVQAAERRYPITITSRANAGLLSGYAVRLFAGYARLSDTAAGFGRANLTFTIVAAPTFTATQSALSYSIGTATEYTLPTADSPSGLPLAYAIPLLPSPLQFDPNSRELRYLGGTANPGERQVTLVASDGLGGIAELTFTIALVTPPAFAAGDITRLTTVGYSFRSGTAISDITLPQATGGTPITPSAPLTYRLTADADSAFTAPAFAANGFTFEENTRAVTGTPLAAATHAMAYHARDAHNATTAQNTAFYVTEPLQIAQGELRYGTNATFSVSLGRAVNYIDPAIVYTLTDVGGGGPTLPNGVTYNATANQLSGVAPPTRFSTRLVLTATDAFDSTSVSATFDFGIFQPEFAAGVMAATYTVGAISFTANGTRNDSLTLPNASGGIGMLSYHSGIDTLPADFISTELADNRIVISGIPRSIGDYVYERIVTDVDARMFTFSLMVHIVPPPTFTTTAEQLEATVGHTFSSTLPQASDGFGGLTYSMQPNPPDGLTLLNSPPRIDGTPGAYSGTEVERTYLLTMIATDRHGASAMLPITFRIHRAIALTIASPLTYTVGQGELELPKAGGGWAPYINELYGLTRQLTFNKFAHDGDYEFDRTIYGPLTITFASQLSPLLTYIATDKNGAGVTTVFTLDILPIAVAPTRELLFTAGVAATHSLTNTPDLGLTYAAGNVSLSYEFTPPPSDAGLSYDAATQTLISDEEFGRLVDVEGLTYSLTANLMMQNNKIGEATQTLMLTVGRGKAIDEFSEANVEILSKVAAVMVGAAMNAITDRIEVAKLRTNQTPSASIGGHQDPMAALATTAKAYVDGVLDEKQLLNDSHFVWPLQVDTPSRNGGAVWGGAHFRKMKSQGDVVDWHGEMDGVHLGVDYQWDNLLLGVAFAKNDTVIDYELDDQFAIDEDGNTIDGYDTTGEYRINIDSQYQYLNWQHGDFNLWLSSGVGDGKLTIRREDGGELASNLDMTAAGIGASDDLTPQLQVRGEWHGGALEIEDDFETLVGNRKYILRAQTIRATTARLSLKWRMRPAADPHTAFFELGMRQDGGDGDTGTALEGAAKWNYFGKRTRFEIGAHGLMGRSEYQEWGAYGQLRISAGGDRQGLALRLRPSYGEAARTVGGVWNAESLDDIDGGDDNVADDYRWRSESRLSYGIQSQGGLFAPFFDAVTGDDDLYRLGVDWSPHRYFDLNLTGERHDKAVDERRVLLRGAVRF